MANTCFKELRFTGKSEAVREANLFLAGLPKDKWGGVMANGTDGYFQDIYFGKGSFHFGTRWGPDIATAKSLADRFAVGFILDYAETMMGLYGQVRYVQGEVIDTRLGPDDYVQVTLRPGNEVY